MKCGYFWVPLPVVFNAKITFQTSRFFALGIIIKTEFIV